ncbi:MAG TPA: Rieske 2Fe-2S domain-containing protein [Thermoleophilaceae bacterium]
MRRLLAALLLWLGGGRRRRREREEEKERIVEPAPKAPRAELVVVALLLCAAAAAVAFIVFYAIDGLRGQTQWFGLALGGSFAFLGAALILWGRELVPVEEIEEDYPEREHPEEQEAVERIVHESGTRITRKRLLTAAATAAGGAIGLAALTPAVSLGPVFDTGSLYSTPWRRNRRLVDEDGNPLRVDDIDEGTFYTAFPEGASQDTIGAPLVVVRIPAGEMALPADRADWAVEGIVAYSKVCTHAGCAISLYRKPLFPPTAPRPALVCPCHYSTFDPARAGKVLFGPAGRALPQLPLRADRRGVLRAAGNFSGPVGPSWSGVRRKGARS